MMVGILRPLLWTWKDKWAERPPKVTKRRQRWDTIQICPRPNSNSVGSELWSTALPVRPRRSFREPRRQHSNIFFNKSSPHSSSRIYHPYLSHLDQLFKRKEKQPTNVVNSGNRTLTSWFRARCYPHNTPLYSIHYKTTTTPIRIKYPPPLPNTFSVFSYPQSSIVRIRMCDMYPENNDWVKKTESRC